MTTRVTAVLSFSATFLLVVLLGAICRADEPTVHLIDSHGISIEAIVPEVKSKELLLNLDFTPTGRDLLLESRSKRPDNHKHFSKLGTGDKKLILDAIGQCRRWHDHFFDGKEYGPEQLRLPELTIKWDLTVVGKAKRHTGKCTDGFWLTFRKPQDTVLWRFDAGRTFKGERGTITVQLRYDYQDDGNFGQVRADGEQIFRCDSREDSYEDEFSGKFDRSRLWEQLETRSFQLAESRLRMLLDKNFGIVLGILRTHPDRRSHRFTVQPGIFATNSYIKAIEIMKQEKLLVESTRKIDVGGKTDSSMLLLPGAMLARQELTGRLSVEWMNKKESDKASSFRVEFGELSREINVDRSAYLYLCVLHQALSGVRLSTPDQFKELILGDVLAEGEWKLTPR